MVEFEGSGVEPRSLGIVRSKLVAVAWGGPRRIKLATTRSCCIKRFKCSSNAPTG
jgi:hypothetical protein